MFKISIYECFREIKTFMLSASTILLASTFLFARQDFFKIFFSKIDQDAKQCPNSKIWVQDIVLWK